MRAERWWLGILFPRRKWQRTPVFLPGESQGRGAWWAAVSGVAQSRTQLKQLSSSSRLLLFSQVVLVNNMPANAGDIRDALSIPGSGKSPGKGHGNPLQYFYLENPVDRGDWHASVHGVAKIGHDLVTEQKNKNNIQVNKLLYFSWIVFLLLICVLYQRV